MPGATADPRTWLRQRSRWSWFEIAFWVATLLPFLVGAAKKRPGGTP